MQESGSRRNCTLRAFNHKIFMDNPLAQPKPTPKLVPTRFANRRAAGFQFLQQQQNSSRIQLHAASCAPTASSTRSFLSSLSVEGSVGVASLDGKRRCARRGEDGNGKCASGGRCHCSKRRKLRVRRSIKVPAISNRLADIPPDEYSWRKYGQKLIKGSPHPRGYYKCSTMRACPARKHVERCLEEPSMLIVTYEGEHSHTSRPLLKRLARTARCGSVL